MKDIDLILNGRRIATYHTHTQDVTVHAIVDQAELTWLLQQVSRYDEIYDGGGI